MFLLLRRCSEYTDNDIHVGCFPAESDALDAKRRYIEHIEEHGDPHKDQAYMEVCLEDDLYIEPLEHLGGATHVYLLYEQSEGFGQVARELRHAAASLEDVMQAAKGIVIDPNEYPPACLLYMRLEVGKMYIDNEDHYISDT